MLESVLKVSMISRRLLLEEPEVVLCFTKYYNKVSWSIN